MTPPTLITQIAPQRSTQYAQLASDLAPYELHLSKLAPSLNAVKTVRLGGLDYLKFGLAGPLDDDLRYELGTLAATRAAFIYHEQGGEHPGPLLEPVETNMVYPMPPDLALTRRYRGKTNELFTGFLCNLARYSSDFAHRRWDGLRLLDPLAGGGTTLFTALSLGADVIGVEKDKQDVGSTVAFLREYVRGEGIGCNLKEEKLQRQGKRWWATITADGERQFVFANGDTAQTPDLIRGFKKPHFIVTDLPYNVQHGGDLEKLLRKGLPAWAQVLTDGGTLVFGWDATRFSRENMVDLVEDTCDLRVLDTPPYNQLAHRVDRVIKQRDVIVAR